MTTRLILLLVFALVTVIPLQAQWTQTGGPEGGAVRTIAANPDVVLAITASDTLYRYDGSSWKSIGTLNAWAMVEHDGYFITSSSDRGMLRSTDDGDTWHPIGLDNRYMLLASGTGALYGAYQDTVYRSMDGGATWDTVATFPGQYFTALKSTGTTIIAGAQSAESARLVNVSFDDGNHWSTFQVEAPEESYITSVEIAGDTLVAGFGQGGVYISTDSGSTWGEFNAGLFPDIYDSYSVESLSRFGGTLWATTHADIYRKTNTGWQHVINLVNAQITAPSESWQSDILYISSAQGIARGTATGTIWQNINHGLKLQSVNDLISSNGVLIAATPGGIYRSSNNGTSWSSTFPYEVIQLARHNSSLFARAGYNTRGGIYRSTDNGLSWQQNDTGINQPSILMNALVASDYGVFAGFGWPGWTPGEWDNGGLYRSTDNGETWQSAVNGLPTYNDIPVPVMGLAISGKKLVAVTDNGVYYSDNYGDLWQATALKDYQIFMEIVAAGEGDEFVISIGPDVFYSSDGGATWNKQVLPVAADRAQSVANISFVKGSPVIITVGQGSEDGQLVQEAFRFDGQNWTNISDRFPARGVFGPFVAVGQTVYAGTYGASVWSTPASWLLGGASGVDADQDITGTLTSTPNPFTTDATIHVIMRNSGPARLVLTDAMGYTVATLHEGFLPAGAHDFRLNGEGLSAGAYFFRLISDSDTITGTMMKVW